MKSLKTYYILLLSCITMLQATGNVNSVTKVATAAANWLKLETGTRAIGMGGAYTAIGKGIQGVPYNPASISFIKNSEGFFSVTNYFAGINYSVLGFATNMSGVDHAGVHIFALDSGDMDVTNEDYPDGTGEKFKMTALCLRGTYSKIITNRLRIGFTGKYIREQIYTTYMQTFAFDIGSNFDTGIFGMTLGMCISGFGPEGRYIGDGLDIIDGDTEDTQMETQYFPMPLTFRVGLKNDVINSDVNRLTISMDAINPLDYELYGTMGMEYTWRDLVFIRSGMHLGHDTAGFTFGGGVSWNNIALDFAYADYAILKSTWQAGLSFKF